MKTMQVVKERAFIYPNTKGPTEPRCTALYKTQICHVKMLRSWEIQEGRGGDVTAWIHLSYRVTIQFVLNLPLTPKQIAKAEF